MHIFFDEMTRHGRHARPLGHFACLKWSVTLNVLDLFLGAALAGLSWTCSIVHYPLLADLHRGYASQEHFQRHVKRIFPLVGPLMAAELMVVAWVCWSAPSVVAFASLALVISIWAITAIFAAPVHQRLVEDQASSRDVIVLLRSHHGRTAAWTIRCALLIMGGAL